MSRVFVTVLSIASLVSGQENSEKSFPVYRMENVAYALGVPHLKQRHRISILFEGISPSEESVPFLYQGDETISKDLRLDLFIPQKDSNAQRIAILFVHGGGFISGTRQNQEIVSFCEFLAASGFVAAAIDYRKGFILHESRHKIFLDGLEIKRAIQWGKQDLKRSIRYLRNHAETFGIAPHQICVIGYSAGAIIALESLFDAKEEAPNMIISIGGAVLEKFQFKPGHIPTLLIHGTADSVVPFRSGTLWNPLPKLADFGRQYENIAASYDMNFSSPKFYGSALVDSILTDRKIPHETYFIEGAGHDFLELPYYKEAVQKRILDFLNSAKF